MANELKITMGLVYANSGVSDAVSIAQFGVTQNALAFQGDVVAVSSASEADVDTSMITTLGWVYMKNLDPTNFVQYGPKVSGSMVAFGRLKAGESVLYRLEPGVAIRWVANAADVNVFVEFYND